MQRDDGVVNVASNSPAFPDVPTQKVDLIRQLASNGNTGDGGLIAQLANNPFFTAVSQFEIYCNDF